MNVSLMYAHVQQIHIHHRLRRLRHRPALRVVAGFTDDDVRFGSWAEVQVQREAAPTRYEAVELVWPAVWEEITRALGEGDRRPILRSVDVIELPGE